MLTIDLVRNACSIDVVALKPGYILVATKFGCN
jgi:hypothetical protein